MSSLQVLPELIDLEIVHVPDSLTITSEQGEHWLELTAEQVIVEISSIGLQGASGNATITNIRNANIATDAAIDWSKISKVGATPADIGAENAGTAAIVLAAHKASQSVEHTIAQVQGLDSALQSKATSAELSQQIAQVQASQQAAIDLLTGQINQKQPISPNLDALSGLTVENDRFLFWQGGVLTNRQITADDLPSIPASQVFGTFADIQIPGTITRDSEAPSIARNAISVTGLPLTYNSGTGAIGINQANSLQAGFLSAADWTTFNGKQNALGFIPLNPANNLSDLANVTTARSSLGLGSAALQPASAFATAAQGTLAASALQPGTSIANIAGLQTALDARQPLDSDLTAIAGLAAPVTPSVLTESDTGVWSFTPVSNFATAAQGALATSALQPSAIGSTVQGFSTKLTSLNNITTTGFVAYNNGTGLYQISTISNTFVSASAAIDWSKISKVGATPADVGAATAAQGALAATALQPGTAISNIFGLQTALDARQPLDSDLTAIAGLAAPATTSVLTESNTGVWSLTPASTFATAAQGTLASTALQPGAAISNIAGLQTALDARQPLDADLTALAALTGSGLARRISDGSWTLDASAGEANTVSSPSVASGAVSVFWRKQGVDLQFYKLLPLPQGSSPLTIATGIDTLDFSIRDATPSLNGLMTAADKTKLNGIATGASNDRVNHTGFQAISTVTGLQTALDARQPLDADLTAIAGLATPAVNSVLTETSAGVWALTPVTDFATAAQGNLAATALQPAAIGSTVQGFNSRLATIATQANPATVKLFQLNTNGTISFIDPPTGGGTTASNFGVTGVGVFRSANASDLQFKRLNPLSSRLTITDDTTNGKIDLDVPAGAFASVAQGNLAATALQPGTAISNVSGLQTALDARQPLDTDLTAIAALANPGATSVLTEDSAGTWSHTPISNFATAAQGNLAATALQPGTAIANISGLQTTLDARQPLDTDLTAIAALAIPGATSLLTQASNGTWSFTPTSTFATAAQGTLAGTALQPAAIGSTVQAFNARLNAIATQANPAAQRIITLESAGGVGFTLDPATLTNRANHTGSQAISTITGLQTALDARQPLDSDLTAIAGLSLPASTSVLTEDSAGVWSLTPTSTFATAAQGSLASTALQPGAAISNIAGLQTALDARQPLDADLTALAALTLTTGQFLVYGASALTGRTIADSDLPSTITRDSEVAGLARSAVSVSGLPLTYNSGTGAIGINQANSSQAGFLSAADWTTFNGKQNALGFTPLNPANNLSDLANVATARTNLGLGSAATQAGSAFQGANARLNTIATQANPATVKLFQLNADGTVSFIDPPSGGGGGTPNIDTGTTGSLPFSRVTGTVPEAQIDSLIARASALNGKQDVNARLNSISAQANPAGQRIITLESAGGVGFTLDPATLLDRANHTGSQAISTVTGLQTALNGRQPLNADLTAISGIGATTYGVSLLTFANRNLLARESFGLRDVQYGTTRPTTRSDGTTLQTNDLWYEDQYGWYWIWDAPSSTWRSPRVNRTVYPNWNSITVPSRTSGAAAAANTLTSSAFMSNHPDFDIFINRIWGKTFLSIANSAARFLTFRVTTRALNNATVTNFATTINSSAVTSASWWNQLLTVNQRFNRTTDTLFSFDFLRTEPLETATVAAWSFIPCMTVEYQYIRL